MLNSKQRAALRSMASKMQPVVQIGKAGAAPEVITSINEALEARELIKVSVLDNCFDDVRDIAEICAERTHSDTVQIIGRRFVLYRRNRENPVINV